MTHPGPVTVRSRRTSSVHPPHTGAARPPNTSAKATCLGPRCGPMVLATVFAVALVGAVGRAKAAECPEGAVCPISADAGARPPGQIHFDAPPPPPPLRRKHAVSLRVGQMLLSDSDSLEAAPLTGVGLSLRVRPMRWLGIEPGVDFFRGYEGSDAPRRETLFTTDLLLYLNPRDAIQIFGLAGASLALAEHSNHYVESRSTHWGVQLGAGLEFRVTHLLSFNVNAVGFSRTLAGAERRSPDEVEAGEHLEHSSFGLLARASASVYF